MLEITTLDNFRQIVKGGHGYIIITDIASPNKIHKLKPLCPWVTEENFKTKVIENKCRNGHYFWAGDLESPKNECKASGCGWCRPESQYGDLKS